MGDSFVADAQGSEFPIQNLPWGVFTLAASQRPRVRNVTPRVVGPVVVLLLWRR